MAAIEHRQRVGGWIRKSPVDAGSIDEGGQRPRHAGACRPIFALHRLDPEIVALTVRQRKVFVAGFLIAKVMLRAKASGPRQADHEYADLHILILGLS